MPAHRESAQKASERIRKPTEPSKKARIEPEAEESVSSHAIDDGSDTDLLDETVEVAPRITLKRLRPPSGADSASTFETATSSAGRASGSAAAPQVISDTEVEAQTCGA